LALMQELKDRIGTSMLLITHDLGIVADTCDKVAIMYAGNVVEYADKRALFTQPRHPYTIGLFNSIPDIDGEQEDLQVIKGQMPDPTNLPSGCAFHPRCPAALPRCSQSIPRRIEVDPGHHVSCFLFERE